MSNNAGARARPIIAGDRAVSEAVAASLKRRYAAERRFRLYGLAAIIFAVACLASLLFTIVRTALPAFTQTMIRLDVTLYPQEIDPAGTRDPQTLSTADYQKLIRDSLDDLFLDVTDRRERRELFGLLSP